MIIVPRPRTRKPVLNQVEIDWSHPLAQGLEACWLLNDGNTRVLDLTGKHTGVITDTANVTFSVGSLGVGISSVSSLSAIRGIIISNPVSISSGAPWSWDGMTTWIPGELYGTLLAQGAVRGIYQFETGGGAGKIDLFGVGDTSSGTATAAGTTNHFIMTTTGTSAIFYLNGVQDGAAQAHTALSYAFDTMFNDTASDTFVGKCFFQRVWTRTLTSREARQLATEPYCFLKERPAIFYSFTVTTTGAAATRRPPSLALTGVGI